MPSMGPGNAIQSKSYMINPAGNIALTLIKSNHSYKFGGEFRDYIFITKNLRYTNGFRPRRSCLGRERSSRASRFETVAAVY